MVGSKEPTIVMNETRYDWLSDRWVIFAPNRDERPDEFGPTKKALRKEHLACPFCSGSEHETPEPTLVLPEIDFDETSQNRKADPSKRIAPAWQVRVVPNKFPAIPRFSNEHVDGVREMSSIGEAYQGEISANGTMHNRQQYPQRQSQMLAADHLFQKHMPSGAHEVIIESPSHIGSITALPADHIAIIFEAYRRRLNHWRAQRDLKYALIFKNYGADAGASLYHSHSQLISLDFVPCDIARTNDRMTLYHQRFGSCYVCHLVAEEDERQERILYSSENFVAMCPFASRFPYSFSIIPRMHRSRYEEIGQSELRELSLAVKATLSALESAHPSAAYNFVLQTSPFQGGNEESFHWRLRVIPRLSKIAGFEWGSDCFINTVTPEYAARVLRDYLE